MASGTRFFSVLGCALVFGAGCRTIEPPAFTDEVMTASVVSFQSVKVGNESLSHYAQKRTAFLLSGVDLPEISQSEGTSFSGSGASPGEVYYGAAAAVDRRGYFVTAAHCVDDNPGKLRLVFRNAGAIEVKQARVVYLGDPSTDGADFAVIHVPGPVSDVFEWADRYEVGDRVLCSGSRQNPEASNKSFKLVLSGGAIQKVETAARAGTVFQLIRHSAPIHHGNSGGPAVDLAGRLVGVNFSATFSGGPIRQPSLKYSSAIRPDVRWLEQIIEADSRTQNW